MRQAKLAAGETDVDELVVWQVKLSHHRLPIGATKTQPLLLAFHVGLRTTQDRRQGYRRKRHFPGSSYRPNNTIPAFNSSIKTGVAPNDFLISSDNPRRALRSRAHARNQTHARHAGRNNLFLFYSALGFMAATSSLEPIPTGRPT